jgi:hypothetical protein
VRCFKFVDTGKNTVNGYVIPAFAPAVAEPTFGVTAWGAAEVPSEAVAGLRRSLGPPGQPPFPVTFLKAVEDQTVAAVAAVAQAVQSGGLAGESFADWAVIGAPRSLGRLAAAEILHRFERGGAVKVTPFLVPHHSLHSVSGTISMGFRTFGPNFTVGGNGRAVIEGLLAALTLLDEGPVPGLWLVLCECDPEPIPDRQGTSLVPVVYRALAMAFRPAGAGQELFRLRLVQREAGCPVWEKTAREEGVPTVAELVQFFQRGADPCGASRWVCPLAWGAALEVARSAGAVPLVCPVPARYVA